MFKKISINTITGLACLSLAMLSLNTQAQGAPATETTTTSTQTTESKGGPVRKLHKKVRNMRPRIKMRKAVAKKVTGGDKKPSTTPTTPTTDSSK